MPGIKPRDLRFRKADLLATELMRRFIRKDTLKNYVNNEIGEFIHGIKKMYIKLVDKFVSIKFCSVEIDRE